MKVGLLQSFSQRVERQDEGNLLTRTSMPSLALRPAPSTYASRAIQWVSSEPRLARLSRSHQFSPRFPLNLGGVAELRREPPRRPNSELQVWRWLHSKCELGFGRCGGFPAFRQKVRVATRLVL